MALSLKRGIRKKGPKALFSQQINPLPSSTLKLIFIAGLLIFGTAMFLFKFELLASLSLKEQLRLAQASNLKELIKQPADLIQGVLQWLSLKALPGHQIFALRAPTAAMLLSSLIFIAISIYLKFRNRYLPYTFLAISLTSPLLILAAHQGSLIGIDTLFLLSTILASFMIISHSKLRSNLKFITLLAGSLALSLLALQPLGIFFLVLSASAIYYSEEFKDYFLFLNPIQRTLSLSLIFVPTVIIAAFLSLATQPKESILHYSLLTNPNEILQNASRALKSLTNLNPGSVISSGLNSVNALVIGSVIFTIYEVAKKKYRRVSLIVALLLGIVLAGLNLGLGNFIFILVPSLVIISHLIASLAKFVDLTFPKNPYPKNLIKGALAIIVCLICVFNIYTVSKLTVRFNSPQRINNLQQKLDQ
ncbi:hypothetical protein KA075_02000 [Candidatus Saccharibacteria bacterium]|nr:hypothetical protein [Candidatus Saccharibacteria bacterium]